jgi:hypothetical protein
VTSKGMRTDKFRHEIFYKKILKKSSQIWIRIHLLVDKKFENFRQI